VSLYGRWFEGRGRKLRGLGDINGKGNLFEIIGANYCMYKKINYLFLFGITCMDESSIIRPVTYIVEIHSLCFDFMLDFEVAS